MNLISGNKHIRITPKMILTAVGVIALTAYLMCLPRNLFKGDQYSTVVTDRNGELLGARIADDGQWRFPPCDSVPYRYAQSLILFEDKYFRWHPGVNPVSIIRSAIGNIKAGYAKSGGSTITMQVIRMSRQKERTLWQKCIEAILATRLELRCSKDEILALYASHAPFGGNVVGLEAASWRYFGRPPSELSWSEAATLAVLPNSPSNVRLGKNRELLIKKRNRLLTKLMNKGIIDATTCHLACEEPLPDEPYALPSHAFHLVQWHKKHSNGERIKTSVDIHLQKQIEEILTAWNNEFSMEGIEDLAAIVIDVHSGGTLAYCGNANPGRGRQGAQVDILRARRSTGSILKPFLYCALLQNGDILPNTLIADIPVNMNGFSPQNFDLKFNGAVPANEALARSLNVPAVHMLKSYGIPGFYNLLKEAGMTTLDREASDYGLSLILGGAEGSLMDITTMYAKLSYVYQSDEASDFPLKDKIAIWYTLDALKDVNRPDEIDWKILPSVRKVAWKTGTSYGFRDGWAIGVTPKYAVGVWAGNAGGQGAPSLTGATTAGPVLFDIFNLLPTEKNDIGTRSYGGWFTKPTSEKHIEAEVCKASGYLKGPYCEETDTVMLPAMAIKSQPCPYHKRIDGKTVFVLPPAIEWYYRQYHPDYKGYTASSIETGGTPMEFIYPESGSTIRMTRQIDGSVGGAIFHLAHRAPDTDVYWHLDNEYIGQTRFIHQKTIVTSTGKHTVTAVDKNGAAVSVTFDVESSTD